MTRASTLPIPAVLLAALLLAAAPAAASQPTVRPGVVVTASIAAGDADSYRVTLTAGDPWQVSVDQLDVDVTVTVTSAAGDIYGPVDLPFDRRGTERLLLYPIHGGRHEVIVRSREARAPEGRYRLRLEALATATAARQRRLAAEADETAAARHYAAGGDGDWGRAAERLHRAAATWRELAETERLAFALHGRAILLRLLDRIDEAAELGLEARSRFAAAGEPGFAAATWNEAGLLAWTAGDVDAADGHFARARQLHRQAGDALGEAQARSNLCLVELARNRLREGRSCYRELLPLLATVQATQLEGAVLTNLGRVADILGEPAEALDFQRRAVAVLRAGGEARTEARALRNLGVSLRRGGDLEGAIAAYSRALELTRELDDGRWQGRVTVDLGSAYAVLGERQRATAVLREALELAATHDDVETEAGALRRLAELARDDGELTAAAELGAREVALWQRQGDRRQEAAARLAVAETDLERGRPDAALAAARRVAALADELGEETRSARARLVAGRALERMGDAGAALAELEPAIAAARRLGDPHLESGALRAAAGALHAAGRLGPARERAAAALGLVAAQRRRLLAPELQIAFAREHHQVAELWLELAAAPPALPPAERLAVADRVQARTLVETLAERLAGSRRRAAGGGVSSPLLDRLAAVERRLAAREERLAGLAPDDPESARVAGERRELLRERDLVTAELRRRKPAALAPELDLGAVTRKLGEATQVLVYFLGTEGGHLWLLEGGRVTVHALAPRAEIETAVRELHGLAQGPAATAAGLRRAATLRDTLARLLLQPVASRLHGGRLVVVPDGAVAHVPFAALPLPGSRELVIDRFELAYLPSLSTLAGLREASPHRGAVLALYADPVVSRHDPRLASATTLTAADGTSGGELALLAGTRREAEALAALAPPGDVLRRLGFAARRDAVLGDPLGRYPFLHFATHGVVDPDRPTRTGLVLSRFAADGSRREGLLRRRDVEDLELAAELVVLSGCQTALGREAPGEGVLGLARSFLLAGSRAVVATQSPLDDRAAVLLVSELYRGLWHAGLSPAAALRRGQLAVRAERRWRDPRYWAGVQLVGDGGLAGAAELR